jgi:hypothetical protein
LDYLGAAELLLSEGAVGFEDEHHGFFEVRPYLVKGFALAVGAGQLLDEADVAFGDFAKNERQLKVHGFLKNTLNSTFSDWATAGGNPIGGAPV